MQASTFDTSPPKVSAVGVEEASEEVGNAVKPPVEGEVKEPVEAEPDVEIFTAAELEKEAVLLEQVKV